MIPAEILDKPMSLEIARSVADRNHGICCVYLNNFRIAGGKPWGGSETIRAFPSITLRELARAIPALRKELGLDYLGQPLPEPPEAEQ